MRWVTCFARNLFPISFFTLYHDYPVPGVLEARLPRCIVTARDTRRVASRGMGFELQKSDHDSTMAEWQDAECKKL